MNKKQPFLWITDPWETLDHPKDTTLRLIEECLRMKIPAWWCEGRSIRWENGAVVLDARRVLSTGDSRAAEEIRLSEPDAMRPERFSRIFYRTDPPVDAAYIYPLQLLELALREKRGSRILTAPSILLTSNEKTEFFPLKRIVPASTVSSQLKHLEAFLKEHSHAVLKPLNSAQSKGVQVLDSTKPTEARKAMRAATRKETVPVILQEYLPGIRKGEVRLWFSAGRLVGKARKVPQPGAAVINMDQGGKVVPTELNAVERKAVQQISRFLGKRKILWAAVDLIDGKITDFNFTSPGLLLQLERLSGRNLSRILLRDALRV